MNHVITELVNHGIYPLGMLTLLPAFAKKAKFVTKYLQQPQKAGREQPGIEEDSAEDSEIEVDDTMVEE